MALAHRYTIKNCLIIAAALLFAAGASSAQEDPPYRVARLNYFTGNVSMEPAGVDQWAPADLNRPFTVGDYLYADQGSEAELHLDVAAIRMGAQTSFGFLNLNDQAVQIKLTEGDVYFRIHNFGPNQVFEVDTPNAAVNLLRDGVYRFRVDPNGNMSFVVVREGQAEVTGGGQAFTMNPGNSAQLTGTDQLAYDIEAAPGPDAFDNWCAERDAHEAHLASARYLPPTLIGYEDLDDYGAWQATGDYGPVWYPRQVAAGWAPYHYGHWAWVEPWGWTWVDDMPWGFAPFHYGRWAFINSRWGWCPGPIAIVGYRGPVIRPYYAPAMVAWFGGPHFGVGVSLGGPALGWVALGIGEIYTPSYRCSRSYFTNVNVYNTRVVQTVNITNVYNTVYVDHRVYNQTNVNMRAPNAVAAMPQSAFASGASVRQAGIAIRQNDVARIQTASVITPPVAPTPQAVLRNARPVPHPSAVIVQRQVVARAVPPAPPASFAVRQQYLQQHAGEPHDVAAMHAAVAAHAVAPAVRQAPAARPVQVQVGTRVGNPAAFTRAAVPQPHTAVSTPRPAPAPPATHGLPPNMRPATPSGENAQPAAVQPRAAQPHPAPPATHGLPANTRPATPSKENAQPAAVQPRAAQPHPAPPAEPHTNPRPESEREVRQPQQPLQPTEPHPASHPPEHPLPPPREEPAKTAPPTKNEPAKTPPKQEKEKKPPPKDDHKEP